MERISSSAAETRGLGCQLGSCLARGDVVALTGELGAGKTTFVAGLAEGLKIDPRYPVASPTFVFARTYEGSLPLHHIDLYRIEKESELRGLGLEEMLEGSGVTVIEWFDRFPQIWPEARLDVHIEYGDQEKRTLRASGVGNRGEAVMSEWRKAS